MNIATLSMEKMTQILKAIDGKYRQYASEPYRLRKASPKEQIEMYENLSEGQLYELIEKHGVDEVNKWLYKMEQRSKNV